jgi:uncharacterized protein (TIGR01777 family)
MKIVVAGANGLIGKALVRALHARGDQVTALVRKPQQLEGAISVQWDGREGPWQAALDGADAVVNLAGQSVADHRWSDDYKRQILESRTHSSKALVEAIAKAKLKPRVLVNASAVGYYGGRGDELIDETARPGTDFLAGVTRAWEEEAAKAEVRSVFLRTGIVLARDGGALVKMVPPFKAFVGGPIGSGKQWSPWIHLHDEVAAILWAIDHEELKGPVNLTAPEPVTAGEFAKALGKVLHRPSWAKVPAAVLKVAVGEFAAVLLEGQRALPVQLQKSGFVFRFPQLAGALEDLLGHRASSAAAASKLPSASSTSIS